MEEKDWYKVEIRELIRKNLDKIHRKIGDSYGIDVSFLHKMISEYTQQEIEKAREDGRKEGVVEIIDMVLNSIGNSSWTYNPEVDDRKVVEMLKGELSKLKDKK